MAETTIKKSDAIREAFQALGKDIGNKEVVAWIKDKYDLEVASANVSNLRMKASKSSSDPKEDLPMIRTESREMDNDDISKALENAKRVNELAQELGGLHVLKQCVQWLESIK